MNTKDVELTLEEALEKTGIEHVKVYHRPRLLSDNGSAYRSKQLKKFLKLFNITHICGRPYHPMTQGKIEREHLSMKKVIKLQNYHFPWELEQTIAQWVQYYNYNLYHESLQNVTPADVFLWNRKGGSQETKSTQGKDTSPTP